MEEARDLITHNKKAYRAIDYPNATGNTSKPKEVFPKANKLLLNDKKLRLESFEAESKFFIGGFKISLGTIFFVIFDLNQGISILGLISSN